MKVLFLDIDGVVNCKMTPQLDDCWPIDAFMALMVGRILENTNAKLVLSSSWRHSDEGIDKVNKRVMPVFDITPTLAGLDIHRGDEIKAWLQEHPDVEKYAILDDDSDMLEEQLPNFFKTSWLTGLTAELAESVIKHLS